MVDTRDVDRTRTLERLIPFPIIPTSIIPSPSRAGAQVVTGRPIKRLMLLSRQEMMRPKLRQ